jgi:hypothetical protein
MPRIYCRTNLAILPDAAVATPRARITDIYEEVLAQYYGMPYPGELTVFLAQRHLASYHDRLCGSVHTRIGPLIR